jgi:hypothetical protein
MSNFIQTVIDCLNNDDFLRRYKEGYFSTTFLMDKDADKRSCAINAGWSISTFDCVFFTNVNLERGNIAVPLTWKEKRQLLKAFRGAVARLKADRKAFLKSLRN